MFELKITKLEELREWLKVNHSSKDSIWLIFPKKSAGANFAWAQIVDVLLCYGWIDSVSKKIDETHTSLRISPRNPKSSWSKINKDKIIILDKAKLIHPNGYKSIEIAKQNGAWAALDDVENLVLPRDFENFLVESKLLDSWNSKGRTYKRGFLEQLLNSKKPETRLKKIKTFQ